MDLFHVSLWTTLAHLRVQILQTQDLPQLLRQIVMGSRLIYASFNVDHHSWSALSLWKDSVWFGDVWEEQKKGSWLMAAEKKMSQTCKIRKYGKNVGYLHEMHAGSPCTYFQR
ncbi:hypothetical protein ACMFMG_001454 [Clarireedia jacksonii]